MTAKRFPWLMLILTVFSYYRQTMYVIGLNLELGAENYYRDIAKLIICVQGTIESSYIKTEKL
jgi:hypothetical protein